MGRFSGSALQNWQQQSSSPAAPTGLQQGAQAAGHAGKGGGRFSDSALGEWIQEDGYVGAAQSWYTGANQQGTTNGWDNGFAQAFIDGQNKAAEQGNLSTYFEQPDATGVVTWDHRSSDGTQKFRFGDIYEDGKQTGNVFDQFGKETGALMMSDWLFDGDTKAKMFEGVTVDQTGKITDDGGMVKQVFAKREENNNTIAQALKAADFNADVKNKATEYREGHVDEAITAGGTLGGAALGAGVGTVILPGIGTVVGGVVGGVAGYFGASENTDALTEQAARADLITEISTRENGETAGFFTGVSQWSGFGAKLISPGSNLVQGFYDKKKGDGVSDFYRTDKKGERVAPTWVQVADVGASLGDMALQFASPVGAAAFTAQMTGQIGGEVGELAFSGGESFDYRRGGFDNIFTDEDGNFDASSAAAGIGKIGIDAVQLGMARGLLGRVQSARVLAGEEAVGQAPGLLGRIGQRLYGGSGAARREAGFKFTLNEAGEATGKRMTLSLLAPSEQVAALGARVRMVRASARSEGAASIDDFYRAAVSMSHGDRKIQNALINGMGEAYEEGAQAILEPHSHGHAIDGYEIFNAAAYGFAGGFGMTTGMNTRMVSTDQKMYSQARLAHGLLTGGDELSRQRWDSLTDVEKRSMAALAKMDRAVLEGAYTKIAQDQAIEATSNVIGVNKMADAVQTVLKQQLGRAANRTDPASVITGLEDAGKVDADGNLLPGSMASDSVVSSARQMAANLLNKHRGLVDQVAGLNRKLEQANADFAAGKIDNDDLTARIDHYTRAIQMVELTMKWAQDLDPIIDRHVTAMYDPAVTVAEIEAEAEELNLKIRAAFNRQITTLNGMPLTADDQLALARAVSMLQTRDPQDQSGSYQVLVPQVSPKLTAQNADNVLEVSHAILPAIRGDYDGDKMRQLNQVYLNDTEYSTARSGAYFIGAGGSVNVAPPKYEKYIVGEMAKALDGTGAMASFASGTLTQIAGAIRRRYAGVIEDAVLNPILDRFARAVRNNDQDARKVLLDGLAEHAGTQVTTYARDNLSNEWLWVDQMIRATLQDFQEVFAAHRPVLGPGPNTDVVMPHRQSSEALKQRRVERAAVTGNTVANVFAADAPFRQSQQMHYSSLVAAVLSAEHAGSRDQLQALALLYESLGQGLTKAEIDSVRSKDEITARVYKRLERLSIEAQRLNPELNTVEALAVIANLSLADVTIDDEGNVTPTGKEVTLAQFLLRQSVAQDRAEKDVIFESSPELQAKHAKLLGMTRPQSRDHHGDKGHRPVNAERAFLATIGEQQLVKLLGDEANIFGPHLTGEQWVRSYVAKSETERRQIAQKLKGEAAYLGPAATKQIPYSLEDVGRGDVSAYRSVVDSLLAVGNNRITIDDKGTLHGEMAVQSRDVSKKFQDFTVQARRAIFEFMGLSPHEQGELSVQMVERLLRAHPDFAARVLDLIPNSIAHAVISPDGKRIANWVYQMFTISDPAEAEMYYWRNLLEAELNAQGVSDWNYDEEEDDGVRGRQYDRLPRRMHRIIQNLAYPENHLLLQQFIVELQQATDLEEFIGWVNTNPGVRGNQAPIVPWVDDVAEFDPDKAGGGWTTSLAGAELREAITNLQRGAQNLSKQLVEERMSLAADEKVFAALRRVIRSKTDPSVVLDPSDQDLYQRMEKSIELAGDLALGLGPQAMVYQIVGAARGFYPQAHTKGVTPDYVELLGAFDALRDAYDYTTNYERVMAALTTLNIEAVGNNPSQIAKDAGRTMDEHGRPVAWEKPTVEQMVSMLESVDTRPLARAMLFPQVMERTPDNKLTPQLLVGKSLKELLDGSSMKDLFPKNDRLSQDAALKYVALVESVARRDFKGHYSIQRAANDRVIARTSGADHVLTTAELEKMAVETLYEIAAELQASAGRVNQALAPGSTDPQEALLAKVREGQRMVAASKQFPHFAGTKVTDQVLEGLVLEHKNQAEVEKQDLRAQAAADPARSAVIQAEILQIDAATERFEERVELLRADDGVDQVVTAYSLPADLFDTDAVEAQRKALVLVEYVQRNTQILGDSTSAMLVLQKLSNQLLDSGRLGEVELDPAEWELLSNSVIAVAIDEMMGATGTGVSVPAYPNADRSEDRRYFDVSFSYLAKPTLDRDSVLVQAAAKVDRLAGRQGVSPMTDAEFINLLDRGLFKEHRLGKWTADIPRASIEANQRIDSAAAGPAVAMAGDAPKRQGVISAATRRTFQIPGDELMSVVSLNSVNLDQDLLDEVDVTMPGGVVVRRPLVQLNNRFARSVLLTYIDANGDQQQLDLLAEVKNLGRPFASNDIALVSGLQEIHLSRVKNAVNQQMVKLGLSPAGAQVEIAFAHPDSQPAEPEWMNNLFFEGTSFLLDADHHESLNSTGWFAPGSVSPEYQAAALDAAKLGQPAVQVVDVPTAADVADLEAGFDTDLAAVLRAKTEKFFANDLGGITLDPGEFYNKVYKDFKLRHFVRGVDPATDQPLLWTAEQVIAHQQTGAPLADVLGVDAVLWVPSDNVLRSMLGEQGTKGVARIFEDQLDVDLAAVPSYRGVTPEMMERFAEGINGGVATLAETDVVNRARQQVLRARPHLDPSEIAKHDLRMKRWRREEEETWIDRGEMRSKDRSEGGFSTQYGMAQAVQRGEEMLKAENVMIDWGPAGVTWVGGRAPLSTDIGKMVLTNLAAAIEADGSKMGWVFRKGQPSNPTAGLLSEVSLTGEKRKGLRVVHGDLVIVELDGFTDYDDATKWVDHFIDRGATVVLGSADGSTELRPYIAEYLESFDYERIAGSDHAYRPSIETRRYQNVRSRASTLTETRGVSKRNFVSLFQTRGLAVEENQAWVNSTSPRLGSIKTPVNLVPVDAFGGFNVPAEQFTNESQVNAVRQHLTSLATPAGRAHLLEQANGHLKGDERAQADVVFDQFFNELLDRIDNGHVLPPRGDFFGKGTMIPLVGPNGQLILYRHGYKAPRAGNKLRDLLAQPIDKADPKAPAANVAVFATKPLPAASIQSGEVSSFRPRSGHGLQVELMVPLQEFGDKKVLEWNGMKYLLTPSGERLKLPDHGFFPDWNIDLVASADDMISKEAVDGVVNSHRNAFTFLGIDFTDDVAKFFGTDPHGAREILNAFTVSVQRQSVETVDALINAGRYSTNLRSQLSEFAEAFKAKGIDPRWVDRLSDTTSSVEAQITGAMLLYLMTPGARVDHVLKSGGFNDDSADLDAQSREMPRLFTQVFDNAPLGSELRTEINRRLNTQLHNPKTDGTGYVLHQDWTFEIINDVNVATAPPQPTAPPVYQIVNGMVVAYVGGVPVGRMTYGAKSGEIGVLSVLPAHRRKGLATGMLNYARSQGITITHSDMRTPAGQAWAVSTGDALPAQMEFEEDEAEVVSTLEDDLKRIKPLVADPPASNPLEALGLKVEMREGDVSAYGAQQPAFMLTVFDENYMLGMDPIAHLWVDKTDGEIHSISVNPKYQRKGIATSMLLYAEQLAQANGWPMPQHSENLTAAGRAWSAARATAVPAAPAAPAAAAPTQDQVIRVDPQQLQQFTDHAAGLSGDAQIDPARQAENDRILSSMRLHGFDESQPPPVLTIDTVNGKARISDGNHRVNFAAVAGIGSIPVQVRYVTTNKKRAAGPGKPYSGQFNSLLAGPATAAPSTGQNLRGFLQFAEAHSSGDNPVTNGMAFDETERQQLSQHSAATLHQATGGDTLSAYDIGKARDFAEGKGITRFDSADALDGGAWRMFTNIDTRPSQPWRVETPAESFHRRIGRDAVVHFSQSIDKLDEHGWTAAQRTEYETEALKVLNTLGLKPSQIGLVDKWVRQTLGQPAGMDRDNIERGHVTGKGALGAVEDILWNVRNSYLPTVGAEVSQLHAHDLQAIFRANKNRSTPWQPRTSMDGKAVSATTWDTWVRVSLGSALDSDNLFDRLFLVAQDGFMHSYQHAVDDLLDLPVSRDELTALDLMDDETNRMLTSLDPDTNILALETMVLDSYGASIDDLITGKPIAGKYRGKLPSAHEVSKRRANRRKWRAEYGIPVPVDVTMKNFRKNGGDLIDYGTSTNALFRSLIHLRVGMATLNPALYLMMGPEQWIRGSLDRAANILTGQSTVGATGRIHAQVSEAAKGNALGTAMEAVGLESRFTPDELATLRNLYQNMGQRREFKSMIYKDLNFRRPHEQAVGRFERGLEKFSGFGMAMQDPTRGMTQRTLARRYLEGVLQHIMALPTENVVSIERLAAGMKTDPTFLQKNFPEAHEAGTNAVAQIRSLKQTTASTMINGIINPMSSSDNALYNSIGNLVFKLPLIFSGYAMNVLTTLTGLQGLDQMFAAGIDGRKKLPTSFLGRVQAHLNGREFNEADDARFDMSTVLEGVDLSRAFIRGGLTHTGLFAFGLLAGGLGLSGEDDETKKRRHLAELQGAGFVYDPRRIENDFRNSDAMFVDWLPFGWESYFRVTDEDAVGGSRSMIQLNWTLKQFISPIIGMEKFFETGDFKHVTWGFQDALGAFPLINTLMWDDAVSTAHEFAKMADDEAKLGGPTNMVQASMFLTNAVGVYERMLFENSFANMIYMGRDRYDRDPYKLPLRDSDGDIQRTIEGDARPNDLSLEQYLDPETGQIAEGYMSRDAGSATLHALTENRGTMALVSSLFTGGLDDSDYWRYNMPKKTRQMELRPTSQAEAEAVVRRLMETAGTGQPSLTADELAQIWKNDAAERDQFVNWAEVDKAAAEYVARIQAGKSVNMALSPINPLGPAPLSMLGPKGKEVLTKDGARAVYQGLFKGSVQLGDESLAGIHISREMRMEIQKEWIHELVQDGLNLGLDQTKATSRMKRLWYGPIDNPAVLGIEDILWSDKISYSDKVEYKQLNTTYIMGPDGRPWATGFRRQGVMQALGVFPGMSAYVSEQSSTSTDSRLNTTDLVNNMNTGLRGLELINSSENIPTDKEIADSIIDAIKEAAAGTFTPFKDSSSGSGYGGYRKYGGYGGYGGGGYGGYSSGGSSYFSKMYALPNGVTPYSNGIPFINTSNPLIRRESVRRERVWSERGRLKQWQ